MQDIFGRLVSIDDNISDFKAQLLQSIGAKTANTSATDQAPVEKLIKQIDTITGYKLDEELKKFKESLEAIRKIYDDMAAKKAQRKGSGSSSSGLGSASESLQKSLKKVINQTEASLVDFGAKITQALEKVTNQIAKGAGIGKIPGAPMAKAKRSTTDLCKCICDCLRRDRDKKSGPRVGGKPGREDGGGGGDGRGGGGERGPRTSDDYIRDFNDWRNKQKGPDYRQWGVSVANGIQKAIESKNPVGEALSMAASKFANVTGNLIAGTGKFLGSLAKSVPGLGFIEGLGDQLGGLFGGMAEGFLDLVLHPLAKEIDYFNQTNTAEFITKGGGSVGEQGDVRLGKLPEGGGIKWGEIAKSAANYNAELDGGKKRLDIWKVGVEDVLETMQRAETIQQQQLKNYKRGISEQLKLVRVTRIGLHAAHQIGADAESTADLFGDWSQKLGMSNVQLGQMSRSLSGIAKSTGIFGSDLLNIAKATTGILEQMRLMGTMSIQSARNIMQLMASAQKSGNTQGMNNLLDVLSKPGLMANSPLSMLSKVLTGGDQDLVSKILGGTITKDKQGMKSMADNAEALIKQFTGGGRGMSAKQSLEALPPEMRGMLNQQFFSQFGVTLDGLLLNVNDIRNATKSFNESITELNKKAVKALTEQQIQDKLREAGGKWTEAYSKELQKAGGNVAVAMQELLKDKDLPGRLKRELLGDIALQQAKSQVDGKFVDQSNDLLEQMIEGVKSGKSLNEALGQATTGGQGQDNREFLDAIKAGGLGGAETLTKVLKEQSNRMVAQGKAVGMKKEDVEISDAAIAKAVAEAQAGGKGSQAGLEAIVEQLQLTQRFVSNAQQASQNPILQVVVLLSSIEAMLKNKIQGAITEMMPMFQGIMNNLIKQPFMQSLQKGNYTDAIKEFGAFLKELPKEAREANTQIGDLLDSGLATMFDKVMTSFGAVFLTTMEPILRGFGFIFEDIIGNCLDILDEGVSNTLKKLSDQLKNEWPGLSGLVKGLADLAEWLEKNGNLLVIGAGILGGLAALSTAIGVVSLAIAGAGGLVAAFGSLGLAIAPLIAAAAPVAVVAAAAAAPFVIGKHVEQVNQQSRDNVANVEKMLGDSAADFRKDAMRRQEMIGKLTVQELDDQIAVHQKNIATYKSQFEKIPKFHNWYDQWTGRAAQWNKEMAATQEESAREGDKIGELRTRKFQVAAAKMSSQDIAAAHAKAQKGEAFQMAGLGTIQGNDIPGAKALLQSNLDDINKKRHEMLAKHISGIVGETLSPDAIKKSGGANTLQDYVKGNQYLGMKDSDLNTTQKAQKVAAENAEKLLKNAGVDTAMLSKAIYSVFNNMENTAAMGDEEVGKRLEKIARLIDPKNPDRAKEIQDALKTSSLNNINTWFAANPNYKPYGPGGPTAAKAGRAYYDIAQGDVPGETIDQQLLRKRLALTARQQQTLGLKGTEQLDMPLYNELANQLYHWGEGASKFTEANATRLNADVVREMYKSFNVELPKALEEKLKGSGTILNQAKNPITGQVEPAAAAATKTKLIPVEERLQNILDSINYMADSVDVIVEKMDTIIEMQSEMAAVSAMLPGIDVEEEIKKRQMNTDTGTNEIVANTGETAENTRRTAILMGALLNCMRRNGRRTGSPINVEGENVDESAFFEQFIDCEWVDATARSPAYVWRQGNIGKKN